MKVDHEERTPAPTPLKNLSEGREMRVSTRLVLLFMTVVLLSVSSIAGVIFYTRNTMDNIIELSRKSYDKTHASLEQYESSTQIFIQLKMKEKAEAIARQLEIIFQIHPDMLIASDLKHPRYKLLADIINNERLGEDGSICVVDVVNREVVYHKNYERGQKLALIDEFEPLNNLLNKGTFMLQFEEFSKSKNLGLANMKISESEVFDTGEVSAPGALGRNKVFWSITHLNGTPFAMAATSSMSGAQSMALSQHASSTLTEISQILLNIEQQVRSTMQGSLYMIVIVGFLAILLFWFLYFLVNRSIIVPIQSLVHSAEIISRGNYEVRAEFIGGGEFRELAMAINNMLDRIIGLIESDEDRKKLQANIMRLLEIVDKASEGDLRARGVVTDDVLGSVTDAFNLMLESIGQLIIRVRTSAQNVSASAQMLHSLAESVTQGSTQQTNDISIINERLEEASRKIHMMAENAGQAALDSERTTETADHGAELVTRSVKEMYSIRQQVQATAKQIKNLGDKSIEINAIVELIEDIASQTNNLALNSAIEASRAGAAGKGFAVVADEIRKLAARISRATKDISSFIEGIQDDTNATIKAMEEVTSEVEEGVKLADAAGNSLSEISAVAHTASIRTSEIYKDARRQVEVMEDVMRIMVAILSVTKDTQADTIKMQSMMQELITLSSGLTEAISQFRVKDPEEFGGRSGKKLAQEKAETLKEASEILQNAAEQAAESIELMKRLDAALVEIKAVTEQLTKKENGEGDKPAEDKPLTISDSSQASLPEADSD